MASPLIAQRDALANVVAENENLSSATVTSTTNLDKHTKKVKEVEYQYQNTLLYVKQMADSMLAASDAAKLFNFLQPITPLSGRPLYDEKKPLTSQNAGAPGIAESVAIIQAKISPLKQFFDTFWDGFQRDTQLTADGIVSAGSQIENTMASLTEKGAGSMEALGKATLVYAMDAFRANMLAGLAEVLRGALSSVPFPFNLAIAGAAVAGASALFKGLQNKIVSPKLAQGGIAYGPTSAIVGEYPGARANPEVIAPLSKLKAIIGAGRAENQRVTVGGAVRWSGTEFVIAFEQAQKQLRRTRGY